MATGLQLEEFEDSFAPARRTEAPTAAVTDSPASPAVAPVAAGLEQAVEAARVEGYEAGYAAGWDDAAQNSSKDREQIDVEFARNLRDLGFTFHEARSHVMEALEPLLSAMVAQVLPSLMAETLGQTIVDELVKLAHSADTPIEIVVASQNRQVLEGFLQEASAVPFTLVDEPTLAEGQVFLRAAKTERHVDLTATIARIGTALSGLYDLNEKAFRHG